MTDYTTYLAANVLNDGKTVSLQLPCMMFLTFEPKGILPVAGSGVESPWQQGQKDAL